jgi:hypothetical protein
MVRPQRASVNAIDVTKGIETAVNQQIMNAILAMNISMYFGDVAMWPDAARAWSLKRWSLKQIGHAGALTAPSRESPRLWLGEDLHFPQLP